jgi:hypothetical protein
MRISGKGLKKVSGYGYGDHYVHLKVIRSWILFFRQLSEYTFFGSKIDTPKKLTSKQRALLLAYAELETDTPGQAFTFCNTKVIKLGQPIDSTFQVRSMGLLTRKGVRKLSWRIQKDW